MLVPFVIDIDSLTPDPDWSSATQRACHKNLLDVWQRIGLLTHDGATFDGSRLKGAISALPQSLRPLWQEVLQRVPLAACGTEWNGDVSIPNLSNIATIAELAFVDETRAEVDFDFSDDCDEKLYSADGIDIRICRLLAANQAQAFKDAIEIAGTHIEAGNKFQDIWDSRFKALAMAPIKQISIVDRYAVAQHFSCPQSKLSGLDRFIRLLDDTSSGSRYVTLYSAWTSELSGTNRKSIEDVETEVRSVFKKLTTKNIKRIKVIMVSNAGFRDDSHDRYVRFGDHFVWDIGLGLEIFEGAYTAKRSAATFKSGTAVAGYKQIEQDLASNPDTKTREIN